MFAVAIGRWSGQGAHRMSAPAESCIVVSEKVRYIGGICGCAGRAARAGTGIALLLSRERRTLPPALQWNPTIGIVTSQNASALHVGEAQKNSTVVSPTNQRDRYM